MNQNVGLAFMVISTICYAAIGPFLKKAYQNKIGPFTVIAISMLILFSLSLFFAFKYENLANIDISKQKISLMFLALAGAINFIGFWLAVKSYDYFPLWLQNMFGLFTPIITGIFAFFILGEKMSIRLVYGLVIMAVGMAVAFI